MSDDCGCSKDKEIDFLLAERDKLKADLKVAAIRLEILTGRMRACHQTTGEHALLFEAEMFVLEAKAALAEGEGE